MTNEQIIIQAESIWDSGYKSITVTMKDGSTKIKRLFQSGGRICVFKNRSQSRGYEISRFTTQDWESIKPYGPNKEKSFYEHFLANLRKYQIAFTRRTHKNLWTDHQADYKRFSIEAFNAYVEGSRTDITSLNALHEALREYCKLFDINHIIFENRYKVTSIGAHAPIRGKDQYNACTLNIKKHLDNKEDFHYCWIADYDVSVSGKLCPDGIYRAWLSHEFHRKGHGHYYLLINDRSAVFSEDD